MLRTIEIEGFKSLKKIALKLGAFNLFIGTNSSGKSNFLDALRVLQGLGYGFTIDEILNGKPRSATTEVWAPIRGGSSRAEFSGVTDSATDAEKLISFKLEVTEPGRLTTSYRIAFSARSGAVRQEHLWYPSGEIYDSAQLENSASSPVIQVRYYQGSVGQPPRLQFEKNRPVLHQVLRRHNLKAIYRDRIELLIRTLVNVQPLEPVPSVLREYSTAQHVKRMGEHGENFAAVVKSIIDDKSASSAYLSWLKQLTPTDIDEIKILEGALGEPLFAVTERRVEYPAPVLSDGTLRFAAIAAAFFQPDMPNMLTIEEIENAIHPSRQRLLVELLKSQTVDTGRQVIATTHSPVILSWLKPADYETTFFCKRDEATGESIIKPLSQIPRLLELVAKQSIAELFTEGWLENAL